jgi:hypothetical protein
VDAEDVVVMIAPAYGRCAVSRSAAIHLFSPRAIRPLLPTAWKSDSRRRHPLVDRGLVPLQPSDLLLGLRQFRLRRGAGALVSLSALTPLRDVTRMAAGRDSLGWRRDSARSSSASFALDDHGTPGDASDDVW